MSPDFKELLSVFNAHRVDYLVVGAHALAAHGHVRATGDLDVARQTSLGPAPCSRSGSRPLRIDVLTGIDGVAFDEGWADRLTATFADLPVPVLSATHLIRNKRAVGRTQDLADVEWLERSGKK